MIEPRHRMEGIYGETEWAEMMGVTPRTIRDWTDKYSIPYYLPGRERFIDAADFWAAVPRKCGDA